MATTGKWEEGWLVREETFQPEFARKFESILCQGNGYMGVRAATEEDYEKTTRYTLVAGTFDKMEQKNTTELPNSADTTAVRVCADGVELALRGDNFCRYTRFLNLYNGVLTRTFAWEPRRGVRLEVRSERFVSACARHVLGQKITVTVLEGKTLLEIRTGIRGGPRCGEPHFLDMMCRREGDLLQYAETTRESGITFVTSAWVTATLDGSPVSAVPEVGKSEILAGFSGSLTAGQSVTVEKLCRIATTRDKDFVCPAGDAREVLLQREKAQMALLKQTGYRTALADSAAYWEKLWQQRDISINGDTQADQLAFRFAVYHLTSMAPLHDNRMNIGAKGLSGKGYMGHTFWDTEIYMLPYFVWEDPEGARSLLEYRYLCLDSARENARKNGFLGAKYPWEAAWIHDEETCPEDHFAKLEYHVTADVAYGVHYYYQVTHDMDFMRRCGCEILFETAQFWYSRLEYNRERDCYEIRDVIGPDEFTHHANNNAFTNYLAHLNLTLAVAWQARLREEYPQDYARLNQKLDLEGRTAAWQARADKLVLPKADPQNILPQDDDYMTLPEIDLTIYRTGERKLRKDYPYPTYTRLKVSKQADVMNLFLLREELFPQAVKQASLAYYEPLCVHESSLSLCAYSMLAADCEAYDEAYRLFERAGAIDLGPNMKSSDDGIHAASLGGLWQCCVLGFCGIRLCGEQLRILPHLPKKWDSAAAKIHWRGAWLEVTVTHTDASVRVLQGPPKLEILTGKGVLTGENVIQWSL